METFSTIIGSILVLLVLAALALVFKYPKQILIDAPAGFLRLSVRRFLSTIMIITLPMWLPLWLLDRYFKWRIFEHSIFEIFYSSNDNDGLSDKDYFAVKRLDIEFEHFSKYLISSIQNPEKVVGSLKENLSNIGKELGEYDIFKAGGLTIVKSNQLKFYDFNFLIQCLDNDFKRAKNFGFAQDPDLSFYGMSDKNTLNNIVGRTSNNDVYAFNLVNGQGNYLALNGKIEHQTKYTTSFFKKLIERSTL